MIGYQYQLIIKNVRVVDSTEPTNLAIANGKIAAIENTIMSNAIRTIEADGAVAMPGFVESHIHLDKALTAERFPSHNGTLAEAVHQTNELAGSTTKNDIYRRAHQTAEWALRCGTTTLRAHTNVNPELGLQGIHALLDLREVMKGRLDIQIVVFARNLAGQHGRLERELVEAALEDGADVIGGSTRAAFDPRTFIDAAFTLAKKHDKPLDLHIDESDSSADFLLPYLAQKTLQEGFEGRVIAGHCCSLSYVDDDIARSTIEQVAHANITVVTLPATNLYLQGRQESHPISRGITRVKELVAAGVNVICGSDNVKDMFNPFGRPDLLFNANLLGHVAHMGSRKQQDYLLESISSRPAMALGIKSNLQPGDEGDLLLFHTNSYRDLITELPRPSYVIKGGNVVIEHPDTVAINSQ